MIDLKNLDLVFRKEEVNRFKNRLVFNKMATYAKYKDLGDSQEIESKTEENFENTSQPIEKIESKEHKDYLINNNKVVVVDVYGDWCGPCKQIEPRYRELSGTYTKGGLCAVVKENVDDKITDKIRGVPTFQFFLRGKPVGVITGGDINGVEAKIKELISS